MSLTMQASEVEAQLSDQKNEQEDEETFFQDVYLLKDHGILSEDVEALKKNGFNTIKSVQVATSKRLEDLALPPAKIRKILKVCEELAQNNGFRSAAKMEEDRDLVFRLPTGSSHIDDLLDGGVESMSVTEFFGEASAGKTQLVHTLCVTAQMPGSSNYPGGKVIFIDTEGSFRPKRIRQIARRYQLDEVHVLENILCAKANNSEHQYSLLKGACSKLHEEGGVFKLLIIDSIISFFRVEYTGRADLAVRQSKLGQMMAELRKISEEFNIAVVITNQVLSNMSLNGLINDFGDNLSPSGGNVMAHAATTRISLKKVVGNVRLAKVYGSPELAAREVSFVITNGGIDDPKIE